MTKPNTKTLKTTSRKAPVAKSKAKKARKVKSAYRFADMKTLLKLIADGYVIRTMPSDYPSESHELFKPTDLDVEWSVAANVFERFMRLFDAAPVKNNPTYKAFHMQTPDAAACWVIGDSDNVDAERFQVPLPKKPMWKYERSNPAFGRAYRMAPTPGLKAARALKIGNVIRIWYADSETPQDLLVVRRCDAQDDIFGVTALALDHFGHSYRYAGPRTVNSDRWELISENLLTGATRGPDVTPAQLDASAGGDTASA